MFSAAPLQPGRRVVWTLTINGKTQQAFGTLKPDYVLDNNVIQANNGDSQISAPDNVPPVVRFEGEPPRTVKVGAPVKRLARRLPDECRASAVHPILRQR